MKIDIKAWAQLLRIPNVFTALADVIAGALLALGRWPEGDEVLTLIRVCFASACLYSAGMVLNDFFDVEEDTRERPFRPIPSGRVRRKTAGYLGFSLLLVGLIFGCPWDWSENWKEPCLISLALAGMIVLYNAWLKRTWLGPLAMGSCRFLNVLLGAANVLLLRNFVFVNALLVGMYICLISFVARDETVGAKRYWLGGCALFVLAIPFSTIKAAMALNVSAFDYVLPSLCWAAVLEFFLIRALIKPGPVFVQSAVKACIFGLIGLDSVLAFVTVGASSLFILLLLIPSIILGRFIYST